MSDKRTTILAHIILKATKALILVLEAFVGKETEEKKPKQ